MHRILKCIDLVYNKYWFHYGVIWIMRSQLVNGNGNEILIHFLYWILIRIPINRVGIPCDPNDTYIVNLYVWFCYHFLYFPSQFNPYCALFNISCKLSITYLVCLTTWCLYVSPLWTFIMSRRALWLEQMELVFWTQGTIVLFVLFY